MQYQFEWRSIKSSYSFEYVGVRVSKADGGRDVVPSSDVQGRTIEGPVAALVSGRKYRVCFHDGVCPNSDAWM